MTQTAITERSSSFDAIQKDLSELYASTPINVAEFGAKGDGIADDTAAIQAAIDATPTNGLLNIYSGIYRIVGSGANIFTRTKPIQIVGVGGPILIIDASVPSTRNVLRLAPTTTAWGWRVSGLLVQGAGGVPLGQHVIYLDTLAAGSGMYECTFSDNIISPTATGKSIYLNNSQSTGGLFNSVIEHNIIESLYLPACGDAITVSENTLNNSSAGAPFNSGIYAYQVSGAANLRIVGNTISSLTGHIFIESGVNVLIRDNELETPSGVTNVAGYVIKLDTGGGPLQAPQLLNNSIAVLAGAGAPKPIQIGTGVNNTLIQGGRLAVISGVHVDDQAGAVGTHIDSWSIQAVTNNVIGALTFTNAGTGTLTR